MNRGQGRGGLVYSTDGGDMCPSCRRPVAQCACRANAAGAEPSGPMRVVLDRKGRAGKGVTLVRGVPADSLTALGKQLRTACGSGGTVKDGCIEVQGDHRDRVVDWLVAHGWAAVRGDR